MENTKTFALNHFEYAMVENKVLFQFLKRRGYYFIRYLIIRDLIYIPIHKEIQKCKKRKTVGYFSSRYIGSI